MADPVSQWRDKVNAASNRVGAMHTALVAIQELHKKRTIVDGRSYMEFCGHCKYPWPCPTRKLADEAIGGGERGREMRRV